MKSLTTKIWRKQLSNVLKRRLYRLSEAGELRFNPQLFCIRVCIQNIVLGFNNLTRRGLTCQQSKSENLSTEFEISPYLEIDAKRKIIKGWY